jgi:predicted TIM-barrel fold metal-dependent hydrolase
MPEYAEFLDIAERHERVFLDTTMALTPFAEAIAPFPGAELPRLFGLGDRIIFGSDFPNIPYRYAEALRALVDLPGADDDWLRAVFYGTAAQLFGLSPD